MIIVTRAIISTREFSQIAENVELVMRNFDEALEQDPGDALVARGRRQGAQIGPVTVVI